MRLPSLRRPSPSMAVSVMALVVASTGTSYAAGLIGSDDVGNGSLTRHGRQGPELRAAASDGVDGSKEIREVAEVPGLRGRPLPPAPQASRSRRRRPLGPGQRRRRDHRPVRWVHPDRGLPDAENTAPDAAGARQRQRLHQRQRGPHRQRGGRDVALQNTADQNGDGVTNGRAPGPDSNPEFSGEIAAASAARRRQLRPPGTANPNHLVVSPRNSDGSFTTDDDRKRFYVIITGDSTDRRPSGPRRRRLELRSGASTVPHARVERRVLAREDLASLVGAQRLDLRGDVGGQPRPPAGTRHHVCTIRSA